MGLLGWEKVTRDDPYYQACLAGSTLGGTAIGTSMGSLTFPGLGTVAGWAGGTAIGFSAGFVACPYLAPGMRRKFEDNVRLSADDIRAAAVAMSQYAGVNDAGDAVKLLAMVRSAPRRSGGSCENPPKTARKILSG